MKVYDKLVRGKISEVIKESGKNCDYIIAKKEEQLDLLISKLDEEIDEFKKENNLKEACRYNGNSFLPSK